MISDRLDSLILNRIWCIDDHIGYEYFKNLLFDFEVIQSGSISAKEYYSDKLQAQKPYLLNSDLGVIQMASKGNILSSNEIPKGSIAVIKNMGVMLTDGGLCSSGVRDIVAQLDEAKANTNISGVILHTSSGGGEALAGQILNTAVKGFSKSKPIVAYAEMIGSSAYLGAMGSREIVMSSKLSQAGSIGAMVEISKTMLEQMKNDSLSIYPDASSEKNGEHRALLAGDTQPLKDKLAKMVDIFHNIVKSERGSINEKALKGNMFFADEAKKMGLADSIGNFEYAVKRLQSYIK